MTDGESSLGKAPCAEQEATTTVPVSIERRVMLLIAPSSVRSRQLKRNKCFCAQFELNSREAARLELRYTVVSLPRSLPSPGPAAAPRAGSPSERRGSSSSPPRSRAPFMACDTGYLESRATDVPREVQTVYCTRRLYSCRRTECLTISDSARLRVKVSDVMSLLPT